MTIICMRRTHGVSYICIEHGRSTCYMPANSPKCIQIDYYFSLLKFTMVLSTFGGDNNMKLEAHIENQFRYISLKSN